MKKVLALVLTLCMLIVPLYTAAAAEMDLEDNKVYAEGTDIDAGAYIFTCKTISEDYCLIATFADEEAYTAFTKNNDVTDSVEKNALSHQTLYKGDICCVQVDSGNRVLLKDGTGTIEKLDLSSYASLKKGSKGDTVKTLQQRLIDLYYLANSKTNGKYGSKEKTAIEKFQDGCGLPVTGIADETTQAMLFSEHAPEAYMAVSCSSITVGSYAVTSWYVDGKEFTLRGKKTKTIKTVWGTYKFDAFGKYEKIED